MATENTLRIFTVASLLLAYTAGRLLARKNPNIRTFSIGYWIAGLAVAWGSPIILGLIHW